MEIKSDIEISVVIPLYNTLIDCFERCMHSIHQSLVGVHAEIIVVDDGSNAENGIEYKRVVGDFPDACYTYQSNKGVSAARNRGFELASGNYVAFVDGDDEVDSCYFKNSYNLALKHDADVVIGQIEYIPPVYEQRFSEDYVNLSGDDILQLKKAFLGIPQDRIPYRVTGSPCGRLYRRSTVGESRFPIGITLWEDQIFNRIIFDRCKTAVVSGESWYKYYQNGFSAMHTNFAVNYIKNGLPFWEIWDKLNQQETEPEILSGLQHGTLCYYYAAIHQSILPSKEDWHKKRDMMKGLKNEALFKHLECNACYSYMNGFINKLKLFLYKHDMHYLIYLAVKFKAIK